MDEELRAEMLRKLKQAGELPGQQRDQAEQDLAFEFYAQNSAFIRQIYRRKTGRSLDQDEDLLTPTQSMKPYRRIRSWFKRCVDANLVTPFDWDYVVDDFIRDLATNANKEPRSDGVEIEGIADPWGDEPKPDDDDPKEFDTWVLDTIDESTNAPRTFREPRGGVYLRRRLVLGNSQTQRSQAPRQSCPDVYARRKILLDLE